MHYRSTYCDRPHYTGILTGAFIVVVTLLSSYFNFFDIFNDILYQIYLKCPFRYEDHSDKIILIEAVHETNEPYNWEELLGRIEKHKPKQIIFTSWPQHATQQFYQSAREYQNVIFGRGLRIDTENPPTFYLEPLPGSISAPAPPYGLVAIPPARHGIHRSQHAVFNLKGTRHPALEVLALEHHLGDQTQSPTRPYLLNFKGGTERLPKVTIHRVLTEGIVPELVEGRHVIIEPNPTQSVSRLYTPLYPHEAKLSMLEYHGLALDTLLSSKVIIELSKATLLSIMSFLLVLNLFLYQYLNISVASWLNLLQVMTYIILGWTLFSYTPIWLPVPEMFILQVCSFLLVFREKFIIREQLLSKMFIDISTHLQERVATPNFLTSREHWSQVVGMLSQMLDLSRLILLERISSDHRVKEIIAWQCSFADIYERRRDFHRHPYSTAIHERKLLKLSDWPFLKTSSITEDQYLMPLIFSGELYGFWVFGIESDKKDNIPQFSAVIEEFASQIAALLYHRQQWRLRSQSAYRQYLQKYLQLEGGEQTYLNLAKSLTLITQRHSRLENVLSHLNTATIAYNLFGNIIYINKGMAELLQASQLTPYSMNLLDIIVSLCDVDIGEAREFLRRIAFEKTHLSLPAVFHNNPDHYYILHLRPMVQCNLERVDELEEIQPFHMMGILCELIDVNDIKQMHEFKIKVVEKIHNEIQDDLKSFTNIFNNIEQNYQIPKTAYHILIPMKKTIDNLISIIDNMYKILNINIENYKQGIYPINLKEVLQSSINSFEIEVQREISIDLLYLGSKELVFSSPSQLKNAIYTILVLLANDAIENSQITIEVQDDMEEIRCAFSNRGFGMPNARLQNYLFGSADVGSEAFMKLRQTMTEARRWAATLEATSEIGVGLRFCLQLKAFR